MENLLELHEASLRTVSFDPQHPHFADIEAGTTKATPLTPCVTIFTTRHRDPLTVSFEAYCSALKAVEITVDCAQSVNFTGFPAGSSDTHALSHTDTHTQSESVSEAERDTQSVTQSSSLTLTQTIRPFTRTYLGYLRVTDEYARSTLKVQFDWKYAPASEEEIRRYFSWSQARTESETQRAREAHFPALHTDVDNTQTVEICRRENVRFVDLDFPPALHSLDDTLSPSHTHTDAESDTLTNTQREKELAELRMIEWKRPREFMQGEIAVFLDSISASDINQGALGDCWFLSALAALTEFPELVRDIFVDASETYNEQGVYTLLFYKNGVEQLVRVDDFFPCNAGINAGPVYSRCAGNELWVLLTEKAFAKLHGSYANITAGFTAEALMDLTGAPCKTYRLDDPLVRPKIESGELWQDLLSFDENKYLLTASTPGTDPTQQKQEDSDEAQAALACQSSTGLVPGHAYTLVSCVEVRGERLCQLRNPWGSLEWTGDWSDHSPLWTEEMKEALEQALASRDTSAEAETESGPTVEKKDDGLFWMSFSDLCLHFNSLSVCFVKHKAYTNKPWKVQRRKFFFDFDLVDKRHGKAFSQGEDVEKEDFLFKVRNPLYKLCVEDEGEFCFTVHQQDTRCRDAPTPIDIGVAVVQKDHSRPGKYHLVAGTGISADRQNQLEPMRLSAGEYLVVPMTSGCKLRQELTERLGEGERKTEEATRVQLVEKDANGVTHFSSAVHGALKELFSHLDADGDDLLSKHEFDQLMLRTEGCGISRAAFDHLLNKFEDDDECKEKKALSFKAFLHAQLHSFNERGCNEERLFGMFKSLGFDDALKFSNGRPAALSVHGTAQFSLEGLPYEENALTEAQEMVIAANGKVSTFDEAKIAVYVYRAGYHGASFMVQNRHTVPLVFSLDMSTSVNVVSHNGSLVHTDLVPPGESVVFHHLAPKDTAQSWSWCYSASYLWDQRAKDASERSLNDNEESVLDGDAPVDPAAENPSQSAAPTAEEEEESAVHTAEETIDAAPEAAEETEENAAAGHVEHEEGEILAEENTAAEETAVEKEVEREEEEQAQEGGDRDE